MQLLKSRLILLFKKGRAMSFQVAANEEETEIRYRVVTDTKQIIIESLASR